MQLKIFTIPIISNDNLLEEINHFLRANRVIDIKKELAQIDGNSCWTVCITYILQQNAPQIGNDNKTSLKVDYKNVLDAATFETFSILRKIRKEIAEREAIPAYAVFTDAELAEVAKLQDITIDYMSTIPGIGKKKIEKFASAFIKRLDNYRNEESGQFNEPDIKP